MIKIDNGRVAELNLCYLAKFWTRKLNILQLIFISPPSNASELVSFKPESMTSSETFGYSHSHVSTASGASQQTVRSLPAAIVPSLALDSHAAVVARVSPDLQILRDQS